MYLYFNNARKLQTMIAHGSPIRQGDSFNLYVCFDLDFFNVEDNKAYLNTPLYCYYKKPKASSFESNPIYTTNHSVKLFRKNSYDEVTYKLVDGKKYIMYSYQISSSSEITQQCGELELVFSFYQLVDTNEDDSIQDEISNAADFSAKLYVEPTYGKNRPKGDESLTYQTNYQDVLTKISNLESEKNVALIEMDFVKEDENSTDDYATLEDRANYIFDSYSTEKKGWLLVGKKNKIENEQTTIESTELYLILDDSNMLIIDGEGVAYNWDGENLTQLSYSKQELDSLLGQLSTFLSSILPAKNKPAYANLVAALEDYLNRIYSIETNAIYDVKYENDTIKKKIGQNGEYQKVADKTDLGITDIENNSVYDVKYENDTIKFRKGKDANGNYTDVANKTDLGITNIENNAIYNVEYSNNQIKVKKGLNGENQTIASASSMIQNNSQLLATVKAVFDALEEGAKVSEQANPNLVKFNEAMQKIQYMYDYFNENTPDIDNKINKLEEIIAVLDNLPEDYNIFETIENIYNKFGEGKDEHYFYNESWSAADKARFSVKGRIQELEHNADSHIMVFMRYADNQQLFTIPTTAWTTLAEPYTNYPDATCYATIQNNEFKDILDMEIIFDKAVEKELLAGIEVDTTTGVITFYALETPEIAITIDTIKIISNLYHTNSLSLDTINQVEANKNGLTLANQEIATLTRNVNNIKNVELPLYELKQESLGTNKGTKSQGISSGYWYQQAKRLNYGTTKIEQSYDEIALSYIDSLDQTTKIVIQKDTGYNEGLIKLQNHTHTLQLDHDGLTLDGNVVGKGNIDFDGRDETGTGNVSHIEMTNEGEIALSVTPYVDNVEGETQSVGITNAGVYINGSEVLVNGNAVGGGDIYTYTLVYNTTPMKRLSFVSTNPNMTKADVMNWFKNNTGSNNVYWGLTGNVGNRTILGGYYDGVDSYNRTIINCYYYDSNNQVYATTIFLDYDSVTLQKKMNIK